MDIKRNSTQRRDKEQINSVPSAHEILEKSRKKINPVIAGGVNSSVDSFMPGSYGDGSIVEENMIQTNTAKQKNRPLDLLKSSSKEGSP